MVLLVIWDGISHPLTAHIIVFSLCVVSVFVWRGALFEHWNTRLCRFNTRNFLFCNRKIENVTVSRFDAFEFVVVCTCSGSSMCVCGVSVIFKGEQVLSHDSRRRCYRHHSQYDGHGIYGSFAQFQSLMPTKLLLLSSSFGAQTM